MVIARQRREVAPMNDDQAKPRSKADAALEREILLGREFTLADAIGRMAGPGIMKGVSPVSGKDQAATIVQDYLARHLPDASGNLRAALLRGVASSELFLKGYGQPLTALAGCLHRVRDSEHLLKELVRDADVEWGRMYGERPYFETDGQPADPDDPYTAESVRSALSHLLEALTAGHQ
jgi:hypothetical protein